MRHEAVRGDGVADAGHDKGCRGQASFEGFKAQLHVPSRWLPSRCRPSLRW